MPANQEHIIVGVDGSEGSIDALKWAARQASLTGAELKAVFAWEYPYAAGGYPLGAEVDWPTNAQTVLDVAVTKAFGSKPESVARQIVQGHPAKVLIDAAASADLLVVGTRGHGGFVGMLLGSVSERVAAHAPCPVLVVRHTPSE